jgi:hypothetical protein
MVLAAPATFRHVPWVYLLMLRAPPEVETAGFCGRAALSPTPTLGVRRSGFYFGCGFYNSIPRDDADGEETALRIGGELCDLAIELGGRPYLHGTAPIGAAARRKVYGDDYDRLLEMRTRLDPDGLFNAGWFDAASAKPQTSIPTRR